MPYNSVKDLSAKIKNHLPIGAQRIYVKAFNGAWKEYKSLQSRKSDDSHEIVAHKVAWSAVKRKYIKKGGQ